MKGSKKKNLKHVMNKKKYTNLFCVNSSIVFIDGIEFDVNSKVLSLIFNKNIFIV